MESRTRTHSTSDTKAACDVSRGSFLRDFSRCWCFGLLLTAVMVLGCADDTLPVPSEADKTTATPPPAARPKKTPRQSQAAHRLTKSGERRSQSTAAMYFGTASFAKEKLTFANVQHTVQLYRATNGKNPADWQEFDKVILKPNGIRLPELQSGDKYIFDSNTGELMIEHGVDKQ